MGLLDTIAMKMNTEYLSDIRLVKDYDEVKSIIRNFSEESFAISEWNDAVEYLTGENKNFETVSEAKEFLLKFQKWGQKYGQNKIF